MAYTPANPYPKGRGDAIRSADWNEAVNEVIRLETEKFNRAGGTVSGNLTVTGTISGTLANNAVTTAKIPDQNVTSAKIADGNVSTAKLANASVATDKLANGSVTTDKIADTAVGTTKLDGFHSGVTTFTLAANASTTLGYSGEYLDSNPRFFHLVAFVSASSPGYISWHQRYSTYDVGNGRLFSYPLLYVTNHSATTVEVRARVLQLRGPA